MKNLLPIGTLGIAGLVGAGLMTFPSTTLAADSGDAAFTKRDEDAAELVLVDDDDDDDSNDTSRSRFTGFSRSTNDNTRSNFTAVSRDRDLSRSDKTRDWTRDGKGDRTRDWSQNRTNDRSRNDTR
ncbi:MAG: hypothetical protein M3393_08860 [Actinomycetota bacterium]|nr:hypothetical protein [Actinomycetota bacterium]